MRNSTFKLNYFIKWSFVYMAKPINDRWCIHITMDLQWNIVIWILHAEAGNISQSPLLGRNKICICTCLFSHTKVITTIKHFRNTDQMTFPSPEELVTNICLLQVVYICSVELLSLFSKDVYNSHTENLVSQNKSFVLKTAI